jgi:sugar O-acyltransferase (sialic acid O-acetyltransferase NeuD family)
MKTQLLIFPYNGNGLEALGCLNSDYEFIGFIDDEKKKQGKQKNGLMVFSRDAVQKYAKVKVLAVPGSPSTYLQRKKTIEGLRISHDRFATIIHPGAFVSPLAKIGFNVLIMAGVVITSNVNIGNNVCILPNSVIHHDSHVKDYCLIGSNVTIAGYSIIESNCYIGSGSAIINNIIVGEKSLVGLSTNVIKSLPAFSKVVGNPARSII